MSTELQTDILKDSGQRRKTITGAVRDRATGKGRMDLLPWFALEELSKHYEAGAIKYGDNNYLKGMPLSWFLDSAIRHLVKAARGQTDEPHWRAAAWNILGLMEVKKRIELGLLPETLNDLLPILNEKVQHALEEIENRSPNKTSPQTSDVLPRQRPLCERDVPVALRKMATRNKPRIRRTSKTKRQRLGTSLPNSQTSKL